MQDTFLRCNAVAELIAAVVRSPERPVALHSAAALQALTDRHMDAQLALQECGGIKVHINSLLPVAALQEMVQHLHVLTEPLHYHCSVSCGVPLQHGFARKEPCGC